MAGRASDAVFSGDVAEFYERYLVPLIFEPYAGDLADRLRAASAQSPIDSVLEVAAGTGVVTRAICLSVPGSTAVTATDLNQAMLDHAASVGTARPVEWHQADAMSLPFADGSFDAVVCQFGAMFFPDRVRAFSEVLRVLCQGGAFIFNVWDRIETNDFPHVVTEELAQIFPADPPKFLARTPHGYHEIHAIQADLATAGFPEPAEVETLEVSSRAPSPQVVAMAFCQGTPLRGEIESRAPERLGEVTTQVSRALAKRFGSGQIEGRIRAHVVTVSRV